MRWPWKNKKDRKGPSAPDPAISQARAQVAVSQRTAERQRDIQLRKLSEERRAVVLPLQEHASANHFADLIRQQLHHPRANH